MQTPAGAKASVKDAAFRQQNGARIAQLRTDLQALQTRFARTKALAAAREIATGFEIETAP